VPASARVPTCVGASAGGRHHDQLPRAQAGVTSVVSHRHHPSRAYPFFPSPEQASLSGPCTAFAGIAHARPAEARARSDPQYDRTVALASAQLAQRSLKQLHGVWPGSTTSYV
jgi:hypothetical protein